MKILILTIAILMSGSALADWRVYSSNDELTDKSVLIVSTVAVSSHHPYRPRLMIRCVDNQNLSVFIIGGYFRKYIDAKYRIDKGEVVPILAKRSTDRKSLFLKGGPMVNFVDALKSSSRLVVRTNDKRIVTYKFKTKGLRAALKNRNDQCFNS